LSHLGTIADPCWQAIPEHFRAVELGAHVIMPNHVHGIITIHENSVGARHASSLRRDSVVPGSLGATIGSFKAAVTKQIGRTNTLSESWQRNYHDHIIRDDKDLQNKTDYIEANPRLWAEDEENVAERSSGKRVFRNPPRPLG
jgi:REP element-mobilizing transposase RayT